MALGLAEVLAVGLGVARWLRDGLAVRLSEGVGLALGLPGGLRLPLGSLLAVAPDAQARGSMGRRAEVCIVGTRMTG